MKIIKEIIFGERAKGQPIAPPKLKTTEPKNRPTEDEWAKQVKFGSRYGHRGSFYQNS